MTVTGQNFETYQGNDETIRITVRDEDTGEILPLNGYDAIFVVVDPDTYAVVIQKSIGSGLTIPVPASGEIFINIDETDTAALATKNFIHQTEVKSPTGKNSTVTTGYMKVLRSRTHHLI